MPSLILYADSRLPCPQRVLLLCKELSIEIDVQEIAIDSGLQKVFQTLQLTDSGRPPISGLFTDTLSTGPVLFAEEPLRLLTLSGGQGIRSPISHV